MVFCSTGQRIVNESSKARRRDEDSGLHDSARATTKGSARLLVLPDDIWKPAIEATGGKFYPAGDEAAVLKRDQRTIDQRSGLGAWTSNATAPAAEVLGLRVHRREPVDGGAHAAADGFPISASSRERAAHCPRALPMRYSMKSAVGPFLARRSCSRARGGAFWIAGQTGKPPGRGPQTARDAALRRTPRAKGGRVRAVARHERPLCR